MWTKKLAIAAAMMAALCLAGTARAQTATSGAIQGVVTDAATGEGLPGVTIIASSPSLQGEQAAMTAENGTYKITNLPPGNYQVMFVYAGIQVRRSNIDITINKTTSVYQKIDTTETGGEIIDIEDRAPTIDPTSTTQGVTLDEEYLDNIPIPGLSFESALGAAAGTQNDGQGVSFSGSSSLENQYVIDGNNTTGLTYGTVGSPLVNDFIEEIEIITGGYQAEYGRSTGGVVNVVTKSGSNEFHGTAFTRFTNSMLGVDTTPTPLQSSSIDAESNLAYDMQFGFDLGGPIIKDKLWFYVGFAPRLVSVNIDRITSRRTDCRTTLPNGELSPCDPEMHADGQPDVDENGLLIYEELDREALSSQQTEYQFVTKLNYALASEHQGQVTFSGTPFANEVVGVWGEPGAVNRDQSQLTTNLSAKWTSKFNDNKTEIEAAAGWFRAKTDSASSDETLNDIPHQTLAFGDLGTWGMGRESAATLAGCTDSGNRDVDPFPLIDNCPDNGVGYGIGGPGFIRDEAASRLSGRLSAIQRVTAAGNHDFKAGVDFESNNINKRRGVSGDAFYTVLQEGFDYTEIFRYVDIMPPDGDPNEYRDTCDRLQEGRTCDFTPPGDVPGQTLNWSAYVQDSWQVLPNLTLNAGVRYEEQRLRYSEDLQGTTDPFTDRELGKNALTLRNMWAPRLGALYDWTKEGRSKVYGSWGRFYESIPLDINDRQFGGETTMRTQMAHSACGTNAPDIGAPPGPACDDSGEMPSLLGETLFGSGVLVAPGIGAQYLDEYIVGAEYEILEDLKIGGSYQHRTLGRVIEDLSTDNAETYILANPGTWSEEEEQALVDQIDSLSADDPTRARLQEELEQFRGIRLFDKPTRDYDAITLTASRRFNKDFMVQASYTYSRAIGNYQGLFTSNNGQVDPNITSQYDLLELLANREGPLPQDRPHYFKVDGAYTFDFKEAGRFIPGLRFRALSGSPTNALARHYLYGPDESVLLPRGSAGRVDFEYGLDLRLRYARDLGRGMTLEVFTDFISLLSYDFLKGQGTFAVDETYTFESANPVVGGTKEDLVFLKALDTTGAETGRPVIVNQNFGNARARYSPPYVRIGAALKF